MSDTQISVRIGGTVQHLNWNQVKRIARYGRHIVPIRLTNTPLWLYFRSVKSSEKSVKL
jgi:hypothetical protein